MMKSATNVVDECRSHMNDYPRRVLTSLEEHHKKVIKLLQNDMAKLDYLIGLFEKRDDEDAVRIYTFGKDAV